MRIVKELKHKDDRKVIVTVDEKNIKLRIFGYDGQENHIVIYLDTLKDLVKMAEKESENLKKML